MLSVAELDDGELSAFCDDERREVEREGDRLLSFFSGADTHVVLPAKERASPRPNGQILTDRRHKGPVGLPLKRWG
jgi:hypothetical protein